MKHDKKQKKHHPIRNAILVLFALAILGSTTSRNEESSSTASRTATATVTATSVTTDAPTATPTEAPTTAPTSTPTATPTATPTEAPTTAPTSTPTATPTATPAVTPTNTPFTVEHDEEYEATREYIYNFLTEKGYEVQTILTVPNIGRYADDNPDDLTVGWYAYVMHKGKWTEFVVLLFNGEVSYIRPNT